MIMRAVFGTYFMIEEALVVASLLTDGGFDVSVDNYGHATIDPMMIPALGGIRLSLPAAQFHEARSYVADMIHSSQGRLELEFGIPLPAAIAEHFRWRTWIMAVLSVPTPVLMTGLALIWGLRTRKLEALADDNQGKASSS